MSSSSSSKSSTTSKDEPKDVKEKQAAGPNVTVRGPGIPTAEGAKEHSSEA